MSFYSRKGKPDEPAVIHEFYMSILNGLPHSVYWIDENTNLLGCNQAFVKLLGLSQPQNFKGSPYQQMKQISHWPETWVEQFKLDDMEAIFSGKASEKDEKALEDEKGNVRYFHTTRVPLYSSEKKIVGLVVSLTDISAQTLAEKQMSSQKRSETSSKNDEVYDGHLPNILMIEDNLIAQCVEKALLTSLHCQVDIAASGDNALSLFNPGKYDLVLMDIGLEDTSGYALAKQLRKMEQDTEFRVPIVALTGYDADVVKIDCQEYLMEGAITKPLTKEQAEQLIQHYVYHKDVAVTGLKQSD